MLKVAVLSLLAIASPLMAAPNAGTFVTAGFANDAGVDARSGTWTASISDSRPGTLDLSLELGKHSNMGHQVERAELRGLEARQIESPDRVPVQFELHRDAGTFVFEGTFKHSQGAGEFRFEPDAEYQRRLR